jgi:hypothetical protein
MVRLPAAFCVLCFALAPGFASGNELDATAARIRAAVGEAWKVDVREREIVIEHTSRFALADVEINGPPRFPGEPEPEVETRKQVGRYTLRFGEKLSSERYNKWRQGNQDMAATREELQAKVAHIAHKFDDYSPKDETERRQLAEYRRAVAGLMFHDLPDVYSPEHGIRVFRSWDWFEYVHDESQASAARELENTLLRLFGVYDPDVAADRTTFGSYLDPKS